MFSKRQCKRAGAGIAKRRRSTSTRRSARGAWVIGLTAALIALPASALAELRAGIRGGVNLANTTDDLELDGSRTGLAGGAFLVLPISDSRLAIQLETLFMEKGDEGSWIDEDARFDFDFKYLEFQPLVKMTFAPRWKMTPSLFAGNFLALNVSESVTVQVPEGECWADALPLPSDESCSDPPADTDQTKTIDTDWINPIDFGFVIGGSLEGRAWSQTFGIDLRYSRGVTNIWNSSSTLIDFESQSRTTTVTGYWYFI
jgi:hypothetical protein